MYSLTNLFVISILLTGVYCDSVVVQPRDTLDENHQVFNKKPDINADIQEFIELFPKRKIQSIFDAYVREDEEVANNWAYIHTSEFQSLFAKVGNSREYLKIRSQLQKTGLNVDKTLKLLEFLFVDGTKPAPAHKHSKGLRGLLMKELRPLVPMQKIKQFSTQKFISSNEFRKMLITTMGFEFKKNVGLFINSKSVVLLENHARANRVDVDAIYEFIASFKQLYSYLIDVSHHV